MNNYKTMFFNLARRMHKTPSTQTKNIILKFGVLGAVKQLKNRCLKIQMTKKQTLKIIFKLHFKDSVRGTKRCRDFPRKARFFNLIFLVFESLYK